MSIFVMLLVLFVWMILTYYSFRVLASAANEGAAVAAQYNGEGGSADQLERGIEYSEKLIDDAGSRALVDDVTVEPGPSNDESVSITVTGTAITPMFGMNLSATGSAPIEEFRPQGDEAVLP